MNPILGRLGATVLGIVTAGCLTASANAQPYTMKMSLVTINDVTHEYYKALKAGIDARSGGRLKVEIYPANQLGQIPAVIEGVALGTIEVGSAASGFFVSLEPRFQVMDGIGMFDNIQHAYRTFADPEIRARLATWGADKGVEIIAPGTYGPMMAAGAQANSHCRGFPEPEAPHTGRRRDPGRAVPQAWRPAGIDPARRSTARDAEPHHRRPDDGARGVRQLQVLRHRQGHDLPAGHVHLCPGGRQPAVPQEDRPRTRGHRSRRSPEGAVRLLRLEHRRPQAGRGCLAQVRRRAGQRCRLPTSRATSTRPRR